MGRIFRQQEFVGLDNFKKLFADPKFYQSFQNTILLIVIVTIITFAFALVFAAILSREKIKGQNFFRVIFYIPNILSVVVISAIFSAIYDPNNGMLNSLIALFREPGEVPTLWLGNQQLVIYSIAIALVWQAIGYYMVMYMASMASIPESIYESVNLDGAGRVKTFFSITIPAGVDKHPNDAHVFHHQYHQPVVPVRQGDDQRRAGRRQRGHPELYV